MGSAGALICPLDSICVAAHPLLGTTGVCSAFEASFLGSVCVFPCAAASRLTVTLYRMSSCGRCMDLRKTQN